MTRRWHSPSRYGRVALLGSPALLRVLCAGFAVLAACGGNSRQSSFPTPTRTIGPTSQPTVEPTAQPTATPAGSPRLWVLAWRNPTWAEAPPPTHLLYSDDLGESWIVSDGGGLSGVASAIAFDSRTSGVAVGAGLIQRTHDGGATWTTQHDDPRRVPETPLGFDDVDMLPSGVAVAVGNLDNGAYGAGTEIWLARPDGSPATQAASPPGVGPLRSVCTSADGLGIATGHFRFSTIRTAFNTVLESAKEGALWNLDPEISFASPDGIPSSAAVGWEGTACAGGTGFWLVGTYALGSPVSPPVFPRRAMIAHSPDAGVTWVDQSENIESVREGDLKCADFADKANGWAAGSALDQIQNRVPLLLHTANGGLRWNVQTLPDDMVGGIWSISFADVSTGVAVGYEIGSTAELYLPLAFVTRDAGESWQRIALPDGLGALISAYLVH